ncbi:MAG: hypothetical protein H6933_08170 [Burkholderiaceae bacterium]|nr:hypothetical protein [Burkholderiaceae bacterium]
MTIKAEPVEHGRGRAALAWLVSGLLLLPGAAWPAADAGPRWGATLTVGLGDDSNLSLLPAAPVRGRYLLAYPSASATWADAEASTTLQWRAEWLHHDGHPEFDRTNNELGGGGVVAMGPYAATAWRVVLQDWHDPVGTGALARPDDEPDHFVAAAAGIVFRADALDGPARLEAELNASRKRYQNHRAVTVAGDLQTRGLVLRAVRRAAPGATQWSGELRALSADYDYRPLALTHEDQRLMFGGQVDPVAGAPWSWRLQGGWQRLGFARLRPDRTAMAWEAQGQWSPRPVTQLEVGGRRQLMVLPGDLADAVDERMLRLAWTEVWAAHWSTTMAASQTRLDYRYGGFADGEARIETVRTLDLALRRDLGDGQAMVLSAATLRRDTDDPTLRYRRRVLRLMFETRW